MTNRIASTLRRYAVPPVAVTAAFALAHPLRTEAPYFVYPVLLAVIAGCAFGGGLRAGLIATTCSFFAIAYLAAESPSLVRIADPTTLAFAFSSLALAVLLGARARIERERDDLNLAVAVERERLETILDAAYIGIGFLDADLRYLEVNEALAGMNGVPVREHLGRRVGDVAPWIPERVLTVLRVVLGGEAAIGIDIAVDDARFAAEARHFVASFLPLRGPGGAVIGVGFTVSDVTLLKKNEADQARLRAAAEHAQRAANAANHMKDEFLMTLSHEMRSPLQGILGWSGLLRGGQLDAKQADQAFETIERIVRQQAELLNGLFDVSRIMAGKMEVVRSAVDLSELVRQAFEDKQFSANRHGIVMTCAAEAVVPVLADPERIHQILTNLLSNAIKFTPAGGRVALRCVAEGREGVITVRDTGEGVPPEFLQHVFERFSQADRSRGRRHRGLGLGLSIVYHLVDLHDGRVTAESPGPGGGTTMTVRLPLAAALAEPVSRAPSATVATRRLLPGIRVLVVEDDVNVRESTAAFLEMRAAQVTTVASARAAIDVFLEAKPDVVISDLGLPGEDGYWFLHQLRALDLGRDVPVIAFSGYASATECARCVDAGFSAHLIKPVDPNALVQAVAAALSRDPSIT
jgi:signal transduction histidine kinase/ActR/RegA family two-component response regulator